MQLSGLDVAFGRLSRKAIRVPLRERDTLAC
jgi:hypothetical protein